MKIAAIADIHGNSHALQAVLQDIKKQGVDAIVNLGDHFSGPLDAQGTATILLSCDMLSIRGNHDRWLVEQKPEEMGPSDQVAHAQLNESHIQWLSTLPATAYLEDVFLCHGTPENDSVYWMESVKSDGAVCMADREQIEAYAVGVEASVILCGHSHIPRLHRLLDGRLLVNPGSVGCPGYDDDIPVYHTMQTGTPDALYAILEKRNKRWSASIRSVAYDSSEMVKLASDAGRLDWASAVATGWLNH